MKSNKTPFFIAEISANHCGKKSMAKKLIKCAKDNGADAVKLQTYTANSMTLNSKKKYFQINNGLWKGYTLWDLYDDAHTPQKWHKDLFLYAKKIGIEIFSTPFDELAVDFLEELNCPYYKISSFEMTDLPLIKKVALTGKPLIISTGTASLEEINETVRTAKKNGARNITLLYCVSNYPSNLSDFNLNNISILKNKFKCRVGLSDHSKEIDVAKLAIACGAEVIEKHIALDNQLDGLDIKFSLKGKEIKAFRDAINDAYSLLGEKRFIRKASEKKSKQFRRSIFAVKNIKKGDILTKTNVRRIRPGNGLLPKYYNKILNKKSPFNISEGEPISKKLLTRLKIKPDE